MDAVASGLLGRGAGAVRGAQQRGHVLVVGGDRYHADTDAEPESTVVPQELVVADRRPQVFGGLQCLLDIAALQQHTELVAAEPRQGIAPADLRLEQIAELMQQGIAGAVAAGVVDDLELVEVQVQQRIGCLAGFRALQRPLEAALELAPVDQPRENVVAGMITEATVEFARLTDVVEHQHAARDDALAVANG